MTIAEVTNGINTVVTADTDSTFSSFVFGFYEQYSATPDKTLPCLWANLEPGTFSATDELLKQQVTLTAVSVVAFSDTATLQAQYDSAAGKGLHTLREYFRHFREDTPTDPIWLIGNISINPQPIVDEQKSVGCEFKFTVGYNSDCTTADFTY